MLVATEQCFVCHAKEKLGDQTASWKQGPHAKAFTSLQSDKGKEIGAKNGVTDPATSPKCLKCHSTAYGFSEAPVTDLIKVEEGVTCQTCHGPGESYNPKERHDSKKKVERAVKKYGFIIPTKENTCARCHNESNPTYDATRYKLADGTTTDFDFEEASKKIEHKVPAE